MYEGEIQELTFEVVSRFISHPLLAASFIVVLSACAPAVQPIPEDIVAQRSAGALLGRPLTLIDIRNINDGACAGGRIDSIVHSFVGSIYCKTTADYLVNTPAEFDFARIPEYRKTNEVAQALIEFSPKRLCTIWPLRYNWASYFAVPRLEEEACLCGETDVPCIQISKPVFMDSPDAKPVRMTGKYLIGQRDIMVDLLGSHLLSKEQGASSKLGLVPTSDLFTTSWRGVIVRTDMSLSPSSLQFECLLIWGALELSDEEIRQKDMQFCDPRRLGQALLQAN